MFSNAFFWCCCCCCCCVWGGGCSAEAALSLVIADAGCGNDNGDSGDVEFNGEDTGEFEDTEESEDTDETDDLVLPTYLHALDCENVEKDIEMRLSACGYMLCGITMSLSFGSFVGYLLWNFAALKFFVVVYAIR